MKVRMKLLLGVTIQNVKCLCRKILWHVNVCVDCFFFCDDQRTTAPPVYCTKLKKEWTYNCSVQLSDNDTHPCRTKYVIVQRLYFSTAAHGHSKNNTPKNTCITEIFKKNLMSQLIIWTYNIFFCFIFNFLVHQIQRLFML